MPFTHRSNIYIRLATIKQILTSSNTRIEKMQLDQIWEILATKGKISLDQTLFFDWFKILLQENNRIPYEI